MGFLQDLFLCDAGHWAWAITLAIISILMFIGLGLLHGESVNECPNLWANSSVQAGGAIIGALAGSFLLLSLYNGYASYQDGAEERKRGREALGKLLETQRESNKIANKME